ncbi:uncharacterized protein LOC141656688 [Silene latifolia]|uniref:uncharacterized protein LOC141656688 n=1 Tax=Silene latifolia TaxID=37657 RepID=UPI003D76D63C
MSGDIVNTDSSSNQTFSVIQVENPSQNITQIRFNGSNYDEWSRSFLLALLAKGKDGYLDGSETKPADTAATFKQWRSNNALVTAWIFNSMESEVRNQISSRPEAKLLWQDIKKCFCQGNDPRIYQLQAELVACRQGPTESLMAYYGRMIKLWDDLVTLDPLPKCSCDPCACDWVTLMDARREKKRTRDFLIGLDAKFDNIRSQILGITPLPELNLIYNRLLQDESLRSMSLLSATPAPDIMAHAVRTPHQAPRSSGGSRDSRGNKSSSDTTRPSCIACKRPSHIYKVCYRVTGNFPEWWGDRSRDRIYVNDSDPNNIVVTYEGRNRPPQDRAKQSTNPAPRAHMVAGVSVTAGQACSSAGAPSLDKIDLNSMNQTQLNELLQRLQAHQASSAQPVHGPFDEDVDWCG